MALLAVRRAWKRRFATLGSIVGFGRILPFTGLSTPKTENSVEISHHLDYLYVWTSFIILYFEARVKLFRKIW